MSIDYGEVERQFLASLETDTGRSLHEWLKAIDAQRLTHRNDIIDWLRRQGFMFSKASWIERIHNNSGRPVYADASGPRPRPQRQTRATGARPHAAPPTPVSAPPPSPPPAIQHEAGPPPPPKSPEAADTAASLETLLSKGKAFRPLAAYVIAEIRKSVPQVDVSARDGFAVFRAGAVEFAALAISARELRLGIATSLTPGSPWQAGKLGLREAPPINHVVVLTDARQITTGLLATVARAADP